MQFLKQSTASQSRIVGPFVDDTDGKTAETALTIANTDVKLMANGAASANKNSGGGTHRVNGMYSLTFDATDTATVGELTVSIVVAGALPVFAKFFVLEEAVYDALYGAASVGPLTTLGTNAPASWINAAAIATGAITSAKFAASAIDAAALATDAVTEIQSGLATAAALTIIDDFLDTEISAIKAKTDALPSDPADASVIAGLIAAVDTKIDTIDNFIDTEIAAIKAKTDQLTFTVTNRVDATASLTGIGSHAVTITTTDSDTLSAIAGAVITILDEDDVVVAYSSTKTDGTRLFALDTGNYTALISATGYDAFELDLPITGPDEFDAELVATVVDEEDAAAVGPNFRVDTAVDWEIPFVLGSLAGTWSKVLFTAKTSPTEQEDGEAVLQIQLTSGGDASDGLIVLNGDAVVTNEWAEIEITDTPTGTGVVRVFAIATTEIEPTNQDYWEITDLGLQSQRTWRTTSPLEPPVIHFDIKRLDGDGKASPNRVEGLLVVSESVTQDVEA